MFPGRWPATCTSTSTRSADAERLAARAGLDPAAGHEELSAGQFDEIYRTSDPELRQRQSPSTFIAYLRDSQARLVNTKSRRQFHTGVVLERDHATVEFDYDVDVGNAIVSEEISWIIRDRATLLGYNLEAKTSR